MAGRWASGEVSANAGKKGENEGAVLDGEEGVTEAGKGFLAVK